jgi:ankyrin repeat protein
MMKRAIAILLSTLVTVAAFADAAKAKKKLERDGRELTVDAFHKSIFLGEPKIVALYLEAGMPADAANEKGISALHVAAREDDPKILEMLLKAGGDANAKAENGDTALCAAADDGTPKHVELLIKAGADTNAVCSLTKTALWHAVRDAEDPAIVALLIAAGADVNARDGSSETPLFRAAKLDDATIASQLIRAGADVDAKSRSGSTPLHQAVESSSAACVKALLGAGANPNVKNAAGLTPLAEAVQFNHPDLVPLLQNAKAPASPKPVPAGDPVAQLKKMGIRTADAETLLARVKAKDSRAVALLLAAGVKPDVRDNTGRPPLWNAIEDKDVEMVKTLLAGGADPNDSGQHVRKEFESHASLAMQAVDSGEPELLRALVAGGAKVDAANDYGHNALMSACMFGKAGMVKLLVDAKANVNATDSAGTPVLWMAVKGGSVEAVKTLLDAGAKLGAKKAMIVEVAAESGNDEIRALIAKAAGKAVQAKAPPPLPARKPASAKKSIDAKQLYALALPIARKWEEDTDLVDLNTLRDAELQLDGRSHNWIAGFYSRSAQKLLRITWDDGKVSQYDTPSSPMRGIPVDGETILDTKLLSDMAVEAGAVRLTDRGIRPSVGLVFNRVPLWYFNYSDPETKKNVMTIAINAQNGEIVLNDAK